ncbi:hypothetical protein [Burkholderia pseudomallei]|uniref:hypothetical protein n=1 Tax=Burkholderia pseudomallei TaxID=28450 RepID=UPI00130DD381|nr:hypothetical protein [Burkholderia pseudomallei]
MRAMRAGVRRAMTSRISWCEIARAASATANACPVPGGVTWRGLRDAVRRRMAKPLGVRRGFTRRNAAPAHVPRAGRPRTPALMPMPAAGPAGFRPLTDGAAFPTFAIRT